jgi:hypothetical protein
MVLQVGYRGFFSLELFIDDYGIQSAEEVLNRGMQSMYRAFPRQGERSTAWESGN